MFTKPVITRVEISKDEAKSMISEARFYRDPDEVVAYHNYNGMLRAMYSIRSLPEDISYMSDEELLEFARDNIPETLVF